jgi:DNA-binding IclR family transcriptional regulator/ABC-type xylose transport system substrate-binding protein
MNSKSGFQPVLSADRTLDLLELLARNKVGISFNDIQHELDLPKSSLSGLLRTLTARHYVTRTADGRQFRLGIKALELSSGFLQDGNLLEAATKAMRRLAQEIGETVFVAVRDRSEVIYMAAEYSDHSVRLDLNLGQRFPAYACAAGKSLLATLPEEDFDQLISPHLAPRTPRTITSRAELKRELALCRPLGYTYSVGEFENGLHSVAAPVYDKDGQAIASLEVAIPAARLDEASMPAKVSALLDAAKQASQSSYGTGNPWRPGRVKVAWSMATFYHQSYQIMYRTVQNLSPEYNADIIWTDGKETPVKQAIDVASLLSLKPDVIIIHPSHAILAEKLFALAAREGIPAINFQRPVRSQNFDFFIGGNTYLQGRRSVSYVAGILDGQGRIAMIQGDPYNDNARNLAQGAYDELRLYPNLLLVGDQPCSFWSRERAAELARTMLRDANGKIDAFIVANDDMAGGVAEVLTACNLAGKVILVGGDGDLDALERLRSGIQHGTAFQDWMALAHETLRFAVEVAHDKIDHSKLDHTSIFYNPPGPPVYVKNLPYTFVDRSNMQLLESFWTEALRTALPELLPTLGPSLKKLTGQI